MSITVPDIMTAMAARIGSAVPAVQYAYGSHPNALEGSPAVVMDWNTPGEETNIEYRAGTRQTWLPVIVAHVMVTYEGNSLKEIPLLQSIITPICDAFVGLPNTIMPTLDGHVDRVSATPIGERYRDTYAGELIYGMDIKFDVKFHRSPA